MRALISHRSCAIKHQAVPLACLLTVIIASSPQAQEEPTASAQQNAWRLQLRRRVETSPGSGRFHTVTQQEGWQPSQTAIIVCDMWDAHHCLNAVRRVKEMAPRMNAVISEARQQGATIIHAPSSCMEAYENHPARRHAQQTPRSTHLPEEIGQWCDRIPAEEQGAYPIDQSDGGEDDDLIEHQQWADQLRALGRDPRSPWKSQIDVLEIHDHDYISDKGEEIWSILEQRAIDHVILLGVHTNMCVLGRPFGLRQMARNGKRVVLMRDLTDTMYNPHRAPFVSHFSGTDLIIEHIEKWVCSTITSEQLIGGQPFRFSKDRRPHVVMLVAEQEYATQDTLPAFAASGLGKLFRVSFVFADDQQRNSLPGVEVVGEADVLLVSVRRRVLPAEQMRWIRQHVEQGKPIVGIRTANHAFRLRDADPPAGLEAWPQWDQDVIGGHYTGHHGPGPAVVVRAAEGAAAHPILQGVDLGQLQGCGSLYQVRPLSPSAQALLEGEVPDQPSEPLAWAFTTRWGGRTFYTSLGHPDDFQQPAFQQLLVNALQWASGLSDAKHGF